MLSSVSGSLDNYLLDLNRIQSRLDDAQRQLSSGLRIERASDDPSAIPEIFDNLSRTARLEQTETNLQLLSTELQTGDSALQAAITAIDRAITIGTKASDPLSSSESQALLQEVSSILEQVVTISRTSIAGRYIFSGDSDGQPLYEIDSTQSDGIRMLATPTSTTAITDADGNTLWVRMTAQQIFDPRTDNGAPAAGNAFAALSHLISALRNGDTSAASDAVSSLQRANEHLNTQLSLIGTAEIRIKSVSDAAASSIVRLQKDLGSIRDADEASAAIALSQAGIQQQAALAAGAKMAKSSLFDYIA